MPIVTTKLLICDRCRKSIPVAEGTTPFDVMMEKNGWTRVSGERFLCPDCSPGYETLCARHKVEEEDYITGADLK